MAFPEVPTLRRSSLSHEDGGLHPEDALVTQLSTMQAGGLSTPASTGPSFTLSETSGYVGDTVQFTSSSGFWNNQGNVSCEIQFQGHSVGLCAISSTGTILGGSTSEFSVPNMAFGGYSVTVTATNTTKPINPVLYSTTETANMPFNILASTATTSMSSSSGYSISFNPPMWECPNYEQVTFDSNPTGNIGVVSGHVLNFVFTQEGTGNGYATNVFMTIPETFFTLPQTFTINPSLWSNVNFAYMPTLIVQIVDENSGQTIFHQNYGEIVQSCGSGSGYTTNNCVEWQAGVCVQWQTTNVGVGNCVEWQAGTCIEWQGTTQVISTQTMRLTTTSTLFTTMVTTTTGYATTQVSTTGESIYVTEVERSYGTITNTQYVYLTSSLNNSSTTAGGAGLNFGSLVAGVNGYVNGYLPLPLLAMAGAVAILLLVSAFMMRRRRRGKVTEQAGDSTEMEATLLDYINAHNGMISMSQASEDLGVSREPLGEAILRLKADGKLPQAWTHLKVGGE